MKHPLIMQPLFLALVLAVALTAKHCDKPRLAANPPDGNWCLGMPPNFPGCQKPPTLIVYHDELREIAWYMDDDGVNQIALLEVN